MFYSKWNRVSCSRVAVLGTHLGGVLVKTRTGGEMTWTSTRTIPVCDRTVPVCDQATVVALSVSCKLPIGIRSQN